MAEATDEQMQRFANERIRPFAEWLRGVFNTAQSHQDTIEEVYNRANGSNRWSDARTDGPPHLLSAGNNASPDDFLQFNTAIVMLLKMRSGTFASVEEANSFKGAFDILLRACVQPG